MNTNKKLARIESERQFMLKEQRISKMLNHTSPYNHVSAENDKPEGPIFILLLAIIGLIGGFAAVIVLATLALALMHSWGLM
ncbi:MAG TPA: hypothetical protein VMW01_16465 [Williamwhitmania sp.]|nr:hypothetical protein [Williamwhitmania sp.]